MLAQENIRPYCASLGTWTRTNYFCLNVHKTKHFCHLKPWVLILRFLLSETLIRFYLQWVEKDMALLQAKEIGDVGDNVGKVFVLDRQFSRARFRHFHRCPCCLSPSLHLEKRDIERPNHYNQKAAYLYEGSAGLIKLGLNKKLLSSCALFHSPSKDFILHPEQKSKLCL